MPPQAAAKARFVRASGSKPRSKAAQRKRVQTAHRALRLAVQAVFFVLAPGAFSSAMGGVRYLFAQVGAMEALAPTGFVLALVASFGYTVLFGRFFCGYACAFGTMGDVLYYVGTPVRRALHLEGKRLPQRLEDALRWLKVALLVAICAACFTDMWGAVSAHDPWTAFGLAAGGTFTGLDAVAVGLLVAIMVLQLLYERSFCKFLCPMGAAFSLMPVLPFAQFGRDRTRCAKRCDRCHEACPVCISPDKGSVLSGECIACGRCADACPLANVNCLALDLPAADGEAGTAPAPQAARGAGAKETRHLRFKGSGAAWVLVRAALLLAVLWAVGATRFLPEAAQVLGGVLPWT